VRIFFVQRKNENERHETREQESGILKQQRVGKHDEFVSGQGAAHEGDAEGHEDQDYQHQAGADVIKLFYP
jgi:hypothetical protein